MSYSLCIFDLDGTLLNTLADIADAANTTLALLGLPQHSVDAYKLFLGGGMDKLIANILPDGADKELSYRCSSMFQSLYRQNCTVKTRIYPDIEATLHKLHSSGLLLAILSNKPHKYTELCIQHYFASVPFAMILGHRPGKLKKPDPESALEIARELHCAVEESIFIGDSPEDIQTGRAAGMKTIGVSWGFRDRSELKKNNADFIADTPQEIYAYATGAI